MVVRRGDTRTLSKSPLKTSTCQQSRRNRLQKIEQSGEGRGTDEYEAKGPVKPSRNVFSGKPELRHHQ